MIPDLKRPIFFVVFIPIANFYAVSRTFELNDVMYTKLLNDTMLKYKKINRSFRYF